FRGQFQILLDRIGQVLKSARQLLLAGGLGVHGEITPLLKILECGINPDMIATFRILSPKQAIGSGKFGNAAESVRAKIGLRLYAEIMQDLVDTVRRSCPQSGGLPNVGPQHLGEGGAEPIQRAVARSIAERDNGQGDLRSRRRTGCARKKLVAIEDSKHQQRRYNHSGAAPCPDSLAP